jgi:tRNA threonylcarbamoyladenosine biosynthesis protein TsaB
MRILALESTAKAASAAILCDEKLEALAYQNTGLTHSRTLMPMVRDMLKNADIALEDIDLIAAATGPGSFTGIRIGASAAKGMAWAAGKPCMGVSTLEATAYGIKHMSGTICCVMDARRNELYNALFSSDGTALGRLRDDRAIPVDELAEELRLFEGPVILAGDGAEMCFWRLKSSYPGLVMAPPHLRNQSAYGVAMAAKDAFESGRETGLSSLDPMYIRLSQAERERLERENNFRKR